MKTGELAEWLNIAPVTVRLWTKEYGYFLSPPAQGGGRTRVFSDQDARIMGVIATMKADGQARDTIIASLKSLQADNWHKLPEMPNPPPNVSTPVQMMPTSTAETAIDQQRRALMREISLLEDQIGQLSSDLKGERESKAVLQNELTAARERVGELSGRLTAIESERQPTDYWVGRIDNERRRWLWVVVAAVLVAVVITAALLLLAR